ncbi:MAG: MarR family transcriptional regulator [Hylemonella sp.]|nr:MarR family transcriptional regulator [Hylemonella sp.]
MREDSGPAGGGMDDGQERLARLVRNAARAYVRGLQLRLEPHDVNYGHWSVLRVLWAQDGLSQRELSELAGITDSTTFAVVKSLDALGYIERKHLPGNNKNVHVFLTRSGKALKRQLIPLAVDVNQVSVEGVSEQDLQTTRRTLIRIIDALARDELALAEASKPPRKSLRKAPSTTRPRSGD